MKNRKSIRLKDFDYSSTHIHMIIIIVGATRGLPSPHPLEGRSRPAPTGEQYPKIWQRNYFEHIIRNDIELGKVREYIVLNPDMWLARHAMQGVAGGERDRNNPGNLYV